MRRKRKTNLLFPLLLCLLFVLGCGSMPRESAPPTSTITSEPNGQNGRTANLALWLAKKDELLAQPQANYDLVMTGWFEPAEAEALRTRHPDVMLLAGLTHTWVMDDLGWQTLLITVANDGNPVGPLQIAQDMYLMLDQNGDGVPDQRCSPPGWENIHAIDPRHEGWQELVKAFYGSIARQEQHDGVIVDMVDAHPFCPGAWSEGVPEPLDEAGWVTAQETLLALIRAAVPEDKWVIANAGHDFPEGSPFPIHLNGYVLENFLGSWGASLPVGLASARRAMQTTRPPHIVVFAADTDDSGVIDPARYRVGLAASLLMDNTFFAFDFGPRDHGGVIDWWNPVMDEILLGSPVGEYTTANGIYRRDFERGTVLIAYEKPWDGTFETHRREVFSGVGGKTFHIPSGDAAIFLHSHAQSTRPESTAPTENNLFGQSPCVPEASQPQAAKVVQVIDGDTIVVDIAGKTYPVRYIGIDTPERGAQYYAEAAALNRQFVEGETVYLLKDVSETDRFDRLLRYVFTAENFVNYQLVRSGYAVQVTFPPDVSCAGFFLDAEQYARQEKIGLWAEP